MSARVKTAVDRMAAQQFPAPEHLDATPPIEQQPWWNGRAATAAPPSTVARLLGTPLRRRMVLVAGLATVAAVAAPSAVHEFGGQAAYAATPPLLTYATAAENKTAAQILTELAARARAQPAPKGSGRYHYVATRGWYLSTDMDTSMRILDWRIEASERERWGATDGSGRLHQTVAGKVDGVSGTFQAGGLIGGFITEGTADALRARLNPDDTAAGWFQAVPELWSRQVVPPVLQATILDILATRQGLTVLGRTTDRANRPGVALSVDHQRGTLSRLILVFDPATGALLDAEEIALEQGELPVRAPATIGYTLWLATGYTDNTEQRP